MSARPWHVAPVRMLYRKRRRQDGGEWEGVSRKRDGHRRWCWDPVPATADATADVTTFAVGLGGTRP